MQCANAWLSASLQLRDSWTELVESDSVDTTAFTSPEKLQHFKDLRHDKGEIVIEVLKWLSRATLVLGPRKVTVWKSS